MWMMGYTHGEEFSSNIQDSFNARRLRPLLPRTAAAASMNPPCLFHGTDLFALNHHFAMAEQNKWEINSQQVVVSSRWNPTPEHLQALEDLYRRGTRTPSAEQIQHITAELRRYGKIEGKNVFYWFQNHKARERQKRRRQLDPPSDEQPHNNNYLNGHKKESLEGANRTAHEVEQAKYWASPTNSSTIPPEKTLSRQGAATVEAESKADGWVQFHDTDDAAADHLQQQQMKNATWQMHDSSRSSSSHLTNIINSSSAPTSAITQPSASVTIPSTFTAKPNFVNMLFLDKPYFNIAENHYQIPPRRDDGGGVEAQTLQLFPILGDGRQCINDEYGHEEEEVDSDADMISSSNGTHGYQFFEFLPLKN